MVPVGIRSEAVAGEANAIALKEEILRTLACRGQFRSDHAAPGYRSSSQRFWSTKNEKMVGNVSRGRALDARRNRKSRTRPGGCSQRGGLTDDCADDARAIAGLLHRHE